MAESFWHAVRDQQYREKTGETERQRKADEQSRKDTREQMQKAMGSDHAPHRKGSRD
jgi:hypothetical protein